MLDNEWANTSVYLALALGLVTVLLASYRAIFGQKLSFLQPDIACVLFMWCGYHLSPILALIIGENWRAFMLRTGYIEHALWMSLVCMWLFTLGFRALATPQDRGRHSTQSWAERSEAIYRQSRHIKKPLIWFMSLMAFGLYVASAGGFDQLWDASYTRGEGNWLEHTIEVRFVRFLSVILPLLTFALTAVTVVLSVSSERSWTKNLTVLAALFVSSVAGMHWFSRGAGIACFCLAAIRFVLLGRRDWKVFALSIVVGFWFSYIGYTYRGEYRPGLGNYLEAAARSLTESPEEQKTKKREELIATEDNFLSSLEAYTTVADYVDSEKITPFADILQFSFNLHPFPNGFIGLANRGVDLTSIMRTYGSVGLTTPTMGDLYITFGYATPLAYFCLGMLYFFMCRQARQYGVTVEIVLLMLLFVAWPISLHSAFRAQWRLINIVLLLLFCLYLLKRRGYFRNIDGRSMPTLPTNPVMPFNPISQRTPMIRRGKSLG